MEKTKFTAIDLFAGAGGLSYGFEMAGFDIKLAIEKDAWAAETYEANLIVCGSCITVSRVTLPK